MQSVRLADAQSRLPALIDAVNRGEEVVITRDDDVPVARLSPASDAATVAPAKRHSLRDHKPSSLGRVLRPTRSADDDLLAEMLDGRG
jgi:antitoxin (DNA-binding transcriptional repressor) of toxin-antitoxin stability system